MTPVKTALKNLRGPAFRPTVRGLKNRHFPAMTIDWIQLLITVPLIVCWRLWQNNRSRPTLVGWVVCLVVLIALNNYYAIGVASVMAGFYFKHSAFVIPAVVAFSLTIRENYPFSNFPMYSNPDATENYLYLVALDDNDQETPLPVAKLTQFSAPGMKKAFKSYSDKFAQNRPAEDGKKRGRDDLTPEERTQVGLKLLEELRHQAVAGKQEMPPRLGIVEVWIKADGTSGWTETPSLIVKEPKAATPQS